MNTAKYSLLLPALLMLVACGQDVDLGSDNDLYNVTPQIVVKSANSSEDASTMRVGEYRTLSVDFNYKMTDDVQWSTSNDCVTLSPQTISDYSNNVVRTYARTCRIDAVSKGTAWITARVGNHETKFKVDVTAPVVADFTVDTSNYLQVDFKITADSKTYDSFIWDFGDGTTNTTWTSLWKNYAQGGTYVVSLTLKSNKYGSDTKSQTITVEEPTSAPNATFSYYTYGYTINITNKTTGATEYYWVFGDGTTSNERSPSHTYSQSGWYTVTLTAYNKIGSSTASTQRFYVPDY